MSKKCRLCGKTFNNNNYQLFGTSCFKTICELLGVVMPKSLSEIGEEPKVYNVTDKNIIEDIKKDTDFIAKLNQIMSNNINKIYFKTNTEEGKETFAFENNTDFKYAIHKADIIVEGNKNEEGYWDLNIEILDRFDFTDFVFPEEYNNKYNEINKTKIKC